MRRRGFITLIGGAAAWPLAARGQQPEQMRRIGVFLGVAEDHVQGRLRVKAFEKGLRDLGWVQGRNILIDYRFAASANRIREHVAEFIKLSPDIIIGNS